MTTTIQLPIPLDPALIAEFIAQVVRDELAASSRPWMAPKLALSVTEAANAIAISRASAYRMVDRGELPSITIGGRKVVPVAALEAWIAEQTSNVDARKAAAA